ncbi:MAG: hypothetical protein ACI9WU_005431, partial [Myxococcota bacterium]
MVTQDYVFGLVLVLGVGLSLGACSSDGGGGDASTGGTVDGASTDAATGGSGDDATVDTGG